MGRDNRGPSFSSRFVGLLLQQKEQARKTSLRLKRNASKETTTTTTAAAEAAAVAGGEEGRLLLLLQHVKGYVILKKDVLIGVFLWIVTISIGTLFYGIYDFDGNLSKGFYFSVNVGYSIGWGVLQERGEGSYWFSIFYVIVGSLAVVNFAASLIKNVVLVDQEKWAVRAERERVNLSSTSNNTKNSKQALQSVYWNYLLDHTQQTLSIIFWLMYVAFGTIWSCAVIGWSFAEGLYFSISTLSTGGLHGIPIDSENWIFVFVGLFAATGVPVMGMAMASIASLIIEGHNDARLNEAIERDFDADDAEDLARVLELDDSNSDGFDKHDFVLLSLVRLGTVEPDLIVKLLDRFDKLDPKQSGIVSFETLTKEKRRPSSPRLSISIKKSGGTPSSCVKEEEDEDEDASVVNPLFFDAFTATASHYSHKAIANAQDDDDSVHDLELSTIRPLTFSPTP